MYKQDVVFMFMYVVSFIYYGIFWCLCVCIGVFYTLSCFECEKHNFIM